MISVHGLSNDKTRRTKKLDEIGGVITDGDKP
jgi:hypothetical protein